MSGEYGRAWLTYFDDNDQLRCGWCDLIETDDVGKAIDPEIQAVIAGAEEESEEERPSGFDDVVANLAIDGLTQEQIAAELGVSERTVGRCYARLRSRFT